MLPLPALPRRLPACRHFHPRSQPASELAACWQSSLSAQHGGSYEGAALRSPLFSWDGKYLSAYQGSRLYSWDGEYISEYQGSRILQIRGMKILKCQGQTLFEWDGQYLSKYQGGRIFQVDGSVPVTVMALLASGFL